MTKKFKMAILGAGHIATKMALTINGLENVEAFAIASRDLEKAKEFAAKYNFTKYYGSYEEMVEDSEIELIYIATPHSLHYENARLCIEHGKNVLVEKAFTANAKQAESLINLARKKNVFMAEAMWTRFMPGVDIIKKLISDGQIGGVDSVEADFSIPISENTRLREPSLAGGALLDLGVYTLTFASMFLGDDIIQTRSRCIKFETGVDATAHIELTYANKRQAFLRTSMVSGSRNEGKINGSKGYIMVYNLNSLEKIEVYDARGYLKNTIIPPQLVNGYEYEVLASKKAIEEGLTECKEMPLDETLLIMNQMDALRASWGIVYPFEKN